MVVAARAGAGGRSGSCEAAGAAVVVAAAVIDALESLNLEYPKVDAAKQRELDAAPRELGK